MVTTVDSPAVGGFAPALRRLYFVRFAFAIVWAVLVFLTTKSGLGAVGVVLAVGYPLFDVGAAIVDARSAKSGGSVTGLYVNMAISLLAAIGIGVAAASGIPGVLRVWGAWAIVAGLVQLIVAISRRKMGGQWPMMLAGGLSMVAGWSFILQASAPDPDLTNVAAYMVLGGIFFLISCLRLGPRSTPCACSACTG